MDWIMDSEGAVPDVSQSEAGSRGGRDGSREVRAAHARKRAFLALEGRREALTAQLAGRARHANRYRDLLVTIAVIRLQCKQLVEPTNRRWPSVEETFSQAGDAVDSGETLADWARPWGGACLLELQADFETYRRNRDRVGRWLARRTKERAKVEAAERLRMIRMDVAQAVRDRAPVTGAGTPPERRYSRDAHNPAAAERMARRRRGSVS